MPISFNRYVNIISGVEGNSAVGTRQLWGRIFTSNTLIPPDSIVEFSGGPIVALANVGAYFGTASPEYARAAFYFGFISKSVGQPQGISFARWVSVASPPIIYGDATSTGLLSALQAVANGTLTLTMGTFNHAFTGLNFSTAVSLAGVAAVLQTAIVAFVAGGALFTAATVTYDAVNARFVITGGTAGAAAIAIVDGAQTPAALMGFTSAKTILSPGAAVEPIAAALNATTTKSNNFGWFAVMATMAESDFLAAGQWAAASDIQFGFAAAVSPANATQWATDAAAIGGIGLSLAPIATEFPGMVPMILCAATNYNNKGAAQSYMYQQFNLTPSVTTDTDANTYDALRVNYYGQTQNAGKTINFYQRGIMMGGNTFPTDMNVYSNELWFKSAAVAQFLSLQLALPQIPANASGVRIVLGALQTVIQQALDNGTIEPGKTLTTAQQAAILAATGDPTAWRQVQNLGYWVTVSIAPGTGPDDTTEYAATYTLIYSKDDTVRTINGTHVLI